MNYSLVQLQQGKAKRFLRLLIHVGEVSGDMFNISSCAQEVWRINEDGDIKDPFKKLTDIFEMKEITFFKHYVQQRCVCATDEYPSYVNEYEEVLCQIPDLPFSNIWMAQVTASCLPEKSVLHLGILTSLRSWNFFPLPQSVTGSCNVGGFGIDGGLSTLIGASLVHPEKLYFGIIGDLAFFYDMNVLGNRHIGNNIRLLVVNNGKGQEFRNYQHPASLLGDDADKFVAAGGHYGKQSSVLVKNYAESLGFDYLTASNKEEFLAIYKDFFTESSSERPMLFEVFTDNEHENEALHTIRFMVKPSFTVKRLAKEVISKGIIGEKGIGIIKSIKNSLE